MSTKYPEYVNNEPPVITLLEYDAADWAQSTCLDSTNDGNYNVVVMEDPAQIVARIDSKDKPIVDRIFKSATDTHAKQQMGK